ncbi:hypothetical protein AZA_28935 [Nitrospirillum viridazoti Y2]|nr:hypothetical protein AZA_28935 [Nitrospirillum amazonense Y2]
MNVFALPRRNDPGNGDVRALHCLASSNGSLRQSHDDGAAANIEEIKNVRARVFVDPAIANIKFPEKRYSASIQ